MVLENTERTMLGIEPNLVGAASDEDSPMRTMTMKTYFELIVSMLKGVGV
jgi:hypothetical protein